MGKRVRLTDDSLNSHGSRVITAGCDTAQYERNPVLLYMHERGRVIGYMTDIKKVDGEITGEPVFDEASELSRQCKKQWEVGSLRMVSIGIDILEMSDNAKDLVAGQTSPTITKSRIFEVSVVDIGANDNAISMRRDGRTVTMGRDSANPLPLLQTCTPTQTPNNMDKKTIALSLGLTETADEAAITAKIEELKASQAECAQLKKDKETLEASQITAAIDAAIAENRITADKKEHFADLGKKVGLDALKATLAAIAPAARLSKVVAPSSGQPAPAASGYKSLRDVPADKIEALKRDNNEEYRRLYRAEYGFDY